MEFKKILATLLVLGLGAPAFCETIGSIDYRKVLENYTKARTASNEIDDKASELQRYLLDKEKEFKKIESPIQKKNFEDATAKTFAAKQEAYAKFKEKKEAEIDAAVQAAVKQVAIENKIDTVVDYRVVFFGAVDITDKVVKKLNTPSIK